MRPAAAPPEPLLHLWGHPRLVADGHSLSFGAERRYQLLLLLALQGVDGVERDRAAALLWPQRPLADARRNLRKVLHDAHGLLPAGALQVTEHALAWPVQTDWALAERAWRAGRIDEALSLLPALPPGQVLAGLADASNPAYDEWLAAQRQRLSSAWQGLMQGALAAPGTDAQLRLRLARRALDEDPIYEPAVAVLVEHDQAQGHATQARRRYDDYAAALRAALGVEPSRALRERLRDLAMPAPMAGVALSAPATGAPARSAPADPAIPATTAAGRPFIGRRLERADALALLDEPDVRLLTLLGPGGVGKSRLAQVLMADAGSRRFGPRCHFLALEDLAALPAVIGRLALQLGVGVPDPAQAATQLARGLGSGPALLVLDNAEHLAGALRPLLSALLDAAPRLVLLATSRVRLHLPQERVVPLPGLAVPEADSRDLDAARAYDAVQLFAWHATAARHDFRLERELPAVLDILDAVGGLPLAIELAAGWTRLLPTAAIAADLKQSLDLLQREPGHADAAARAEHASVGRVLEQTWALLSPAERTALEALSAFQGGCARDAARDVADCPLALAAALADKSLLATDELGRFQLHPLVAAFAGQRLDADAPRAAVVRDRHAQHYSRLAAALAPHAVGDTRLLAAGIEAEFANLQAAWRHAMAHRRADRLAAMTRALWAWYEARSRQAEGVATMQPALACIDDGAPDAAWARARLAHGVSMLLHRSGRNAEAQALARAAIEPSADAGDTEAHVGCILNTGSCLLADGQADAALQLFQRAEAVASQRGHRQCQAWARGNAAVALQLLSRQDESRSVFQQALLGSREVGDQYNVGVHLVNLGNLELDAARWDDALRWLEAARAHARQHGLQVLALYAQANLANLLRQQGDLAAARAHFSDAVEMCRRSGTYLVEWGARLGLARIDIAEGHLAPALRGIQAVVREALALGSSGDVLLACAVYGDWLAAGGDMAAAAGCWRLVLDGRLLNQRRRDQIEARIREAGPAVQALPAASLGEVLVRLQGHC